MRTLVTGATGLLGNNVVRLLLERGEAVRVLARQTSDAKTLAGLDVERSEGDVRDADAVRRACRDANVVLHCAARVHIGRRDLAEQREVNVAGTRNVGNAALEAGARMVHVSSVDALGAGQRDQPANEDSPLDGKPNCTYVVTKREAEQEVLHLVEGGLDAVIVNPGFMLGPWDWKPSSGRMLLQVVRRAPPVAPTGGSSVADVRDVADGLLRAARNGVAGRRYILAGENLAYLDQWKLFARVGEVRPPRFRMGPIVRWLVATYGESRAMLTGRETDVNSASMAMSSHFGFYSSARAESELGYVHRPAEEAVRAAWDWFREKGYTA